MVCDDNLLWLQSKLNYLHAALLYCLKLFSKSYHTFFFIKNTQMVLQSLLLMLQIGSIFVSDLWSVY